VWKLFRSPSTWLRANGQVIELTEAIPFVVSFVEP
jgi:hypothetical protein